MNYLDGVVNPHRYLQAAKMVLGKSPEDASIALKVGGRTIDAATVQSLYEANGLRTGFFHAEHDIVPHALTKTVSKPVDFIRDATEKREDFTRMTHFLDALQKEGAKGGDLNSIARRAADRVRKFNFDYQDLTPFEQKAMRRVIPFYTFVRKNIPVQFEMLAMRPGRVGIIPKGTRALETALGTRTGGGAGPMPGLPSVIPDWIKEQNPALIRGDNTGKDPLFFGPDFPIHQIPQYFEGFAQSPSAGVAGIGQEALAGVSPLIQMPYEYSTGRDLSTGQQIPRDLPRIVSNEVPLTSLARSLVGNLGPGEKRPPDIHFKIGGKNVSVNERLLNYLLGPGVRDLNTNRIKSQLKKQKGMH